MHSGLKWSFAIPLFIMPKYYCDYCDTFLTHDSASVRKSHLEGLRHQNAVRAYYAQFVPNTSDYDDSEMQRYEKMKGNYCFWIICPIEDEIKTSNPTFLLSGRVAFCDDSSASPPHAARYDLIFWLIPSVTHLKFSIPHNGRLDFDKWALFTRFMIYSRPKGRLR